MIDKFSDGWDSAKLVVTQSNQKLMFSPSGLSDYEYGPILEFNSNTNKDGDSIVIQVYTYNSKHLWEVI